MYWEIQRRKKEQGWASGMFVDRVKQYCTFPLQALLDPWQLGKGVFTVFETSVIRKEPEGVSLIFLI